MSVMANITNCLAVGAPNMLYLLNNPDGCCCVGMPIAPAAGLGLGDGMAWPNTTAKRHTAAKVAAKILFILLIKVPLP